MRRAFLFVALGFTTARASDVVAPSYPEGPFAKLPEVNVVLMGVADGNGRILKPAGLYNDGSREFMDAAAAAMAASKFAPGREVILWYTFRLVQPTTVTDISRDLPQAVDEAPVLKEYTAPKFPPGAPSLRAEIPLDIFVGKDGRVWFALPAGDDVDPLYLERAIAAAEDFTFSPARRSGKETVAWVQFVVDFE